MSQLGPDSEVSAFEGQVCITPMNGHRQFDWRIEEYWQAATSSRGYTGRASERTEAPPIARTTLTLIRAPSASRLVYIDSVYRHVAPNHLIIVGKAPATITASGRASIFEEDSDAHSGFGDFDDCDGFGRAVGSRADV